MPGNPGTTPTGLYLQSVAGKELKENSKASNAIYTLLPPAMNTAGAGDIVAGHRHGGRVGERRRYDDGVGGCPHRGEGQASGLLVDQISLSDRWDKAGLEALEGKNGVYFLTVL